MPPVVALLIAVLALAGCDILGITGPDTETLEVAPYRLECRGEALSLCLQVRTPGEPSFGNLFFGVDGFRFEWGFNYVIEIEVSDIENVPADGSSIRRSLKRIVARNRVPDDATFEITLTSAEGRVRSVGEDSYEFFFGAGEFVCPIGVECDELAMAISEERRIAYRFRYGMPGEPFEIERWASCPAEQPFGSCPVDPTP